MSQNEPKARRCPRTDWPRYLMAVAPERVKAVANEISGPWTVEDVQIPQAGLALLQLRDGALGDTYFPGEIPLATAWIRIREGDRILGEGAAQLVDDRAGLARAIAVLDAILAAGLAGQETIWSLLEEGRQHVEAIQRDRRRLLAATRVDFSLLGAEEMDDE